MRYLLSMELSQVAESHGESLRVILLDPKIDWLQAAHIEKQLGLLQSHGAVWHTRGHIKDWHKSFVVLVFRFV